MSDEISYLGTIQPSKALDIQYKAYTRQFEYGVVLFLTATCAYPRLQYEIFFQVEGGFTWTLMEKEPTISSPIISYHIASTTLGQPTADTPNTVTVIDGYGSHEVVVENDSTDD
ncbi:MAG: hypothetical protein IPO81_31725 [Kouleothrix sp.]|nr:hypothetical protein [Kouleothrix sp.]